MAWKRKDLLSMQDLEPAEITDVSKNDIMADFLREYRSSMTAVKT